MIYRYMQTAAFRRFIILTMLACLDVTAGYFMIVVTQQ